MRVAAVPGCHPRPSRHGAATRTNMFLLLILATLVLASTIYLLRQFHDRSLGAADATTDALRSESEPAHDLRKAA